MRSHMGTTNFLIGSVHAYWAKYNPQSVGRRTWQSHTFTYGSDRIPIGSLACVLAQIQSPKFWKANLAIGVPLRVRSFQTMHSCWGMEPKETRPLNLPCSLFASVHARVHVRVQRRLTVVVCGRAFSVCSCGTQRASRHADLLCFEPVH